MVSTLAAALLAALGLSGPSATHAAPPSGATFFVSGHGWGHGVGLAQYGAYGYALHGWAAEDIVAHYYPGTELGQAPVKRVRVLLVPGSKRVVVSSRSPFSVRDAAGKTHKLPAGKQELGPGLKLKLAASAKALPGPLVFAPGTAPLALGDRAYRGTLRVTGGKAVRVVNTVGLEPYLWGVVPSEMPDTWPAEALKSQAIVARTYALTHMQGGGDFDMYPDTRSQVYGGMPAESDSAREAVSETSGEVVLYKGELAQTFFFSSSGGRTANVQDVWGGSKATPYLVSVPDPYDTLSPYHDWGPLVFTPAKLKQVLKVPGRLLDVQTTVNRSQRVDSVRAVGEKGEHVLTGDEVRTALGLRSTWFSVGVLALDPLPAKTLQYGTSFNLTGLGRALPDLRLEQRAPGTAEWVVNRNVEIDDDGSFSVAVKAAAPEEFRVTSGTIATSSTKLVVAPRVAVKVSADLATLKGSVRPVLPGMPVQIQHQNATSGRWGTVAKVDATRTGRFVWTPPLLDGTYRARVVARGGWAVGLSKKVLVG